VTLIKRPVALATLGGVLSLVATIILIAVSRDWALSTPIAGDPTLYGDTASSILAGGVPYLDVTVEHLPVLLVPILAVGLLSLITSTSFAALWPLVTIAVVVATVAFAGRIQLVDGYQRRIAVAMLPMLPLIIYRLEIYVVLLTLVALASFASSWYRAGSIWTLLGVLAKGWPIALVAIPFRKKHKGLAIGTLGATAAALGLIVLLPGFQQGRSFSGIHSETVVGDLILVFRNLVGTDLGLIRAAGATYVSAPASAVIVNAAIAIPIIGVAIWAVFHTSRTVHLVSVVGLGVMGIILLSPLFSTQFVFWLVPFVVVLSGRSRAIYIVAAALSTTTVAFWNPNEAWWAFGVLARNVVFLALALVWIQELKINLGSTASPSLEG